MRNEFMGILTVKLLTNKQATCNAKERNVATGEIRLLARFERIDNIVFDFGVDAPQIAK